MSFNRILTWLLIVGIAGYFIWFLVAYEYVYVNNDIVYSEEAKRNRFLAAQRFLKQHQRTSHSKHFYQHVVPKLEREDSLFLVQYEQTLNEEQSEAVLNWVMRGGHLLFVSEMLDHTIDSSKTDDNEADSNAIATDDSNTDSAKQETESETTENEENGSSPVYDHIHGQLQALQYEDKKLWGEQGQPLEIEWYNETWRVQFIPYFYLKSSDNESPPIRQFDGSEGSHVLHYAWGNGYITLLSDSELFENANIEKYDHAAFLWALLHLERTPDTIWFLDNERAVIPTLLDLLWRYAWMVVIVATLMLIFWLWRVSQRFGSVLPTPSKARRRLLEHIEASGHFLWQHQQAGLLLDSVRQALHDRIAQVHPDWAHLSETNLVERLAQVSHFAPDDIERALHQPLVNNSAHFTQAIQILTRIRKQL